MGSHHACHPHSPHPLGGLACITLSHQGPRQAWGLGWLFLGHRGTLLALTSSPVSGANFRMVSGLPGPTLGVREVALS